MALLSWNLDIWHFPSGKERGYSTGWSDSPQSSKQIVTYKSITCSVVSDCLPPHGLYPARPSVLGIFPGKNTGMACHFLLQRIFPTQGSNPPLLHYRRILYCLSHGRSLLTYKGGYKTVSGIPRILSSLSLSEGDEPVLLSLLVMVNLGV